MARSPKQSHQLRARIFSPAPIRERGRTNDRNCETPKRNPIFSLQRSTSKKKNKTISNFQEKQELSQKKQCVQFLRKMLERVEIKNNLIKQLEVQNVELKKQNEQLQIQNTQTLKRIVICSGLQKFKVRNAEYRARLLKAESLLYQLRASVKEPIKGLDELIASLHI